MDKEKEVVTESQQVEDIREFIELLKNMDESSRQRTRGYMDALKSLSGQQVACTA